MRSCSVLEPQQSLPIRAGVMITLTAIFCLLSGVFDFGLSQLHLIMPLYGASLLATALLGGFQRALSHRIGWMLAAFYAWLVLGIPFSVWPGGSYSAVLVALELGLGVYLITAGQLSCRADLRRAIHMVAYGGLVLAVLAMVAGTTIDGPLAPPVGRYSNPNDFGLILLLTLPFWLYMIHSPLSSSLRRAIALPACVFLLLMIVRTGSRGSMIGVAVVALSFFLRSNLRLKFILLAGGAVLTCCALLVLPQNVKERYFVLFDAGEADGSVSEEVARTAESAKESSGARLQLLKDSISVTATHPLLGVGAGQFQVAQDSLAQERGAERGGWQVTHNSYTQASSEGGIPAMIFYCGALGACIWVTRRRFTPAASQDPAIADLAELAAGLRTTLAAYAVSTFFISVAFGMYISLLAGLAVALDRIVSKTAGSLAAARPPAAEPSSSVPAFRRQDLTVSR